MSHNKGNIIMDFMFLKHFLLDNIGTWVEHVVGWHAW